MTSIAGRMVSGNVGNNVCNEVGNNVGNDVGNGVGYMRRRRTWPEEGRRIPMLARVSRVGGREINLDKRMRMVKGRIFDHFFFWNLVVS